MTFMVTQGHRKCRYLKDHTSLHINGL